MDPNENLRKQLELAEEILIDSRYRRRPESDSARELAELVQDMDRWIKQGGFLPSAWAYELKRPR